MQIELLMKCCHENVQGWSPIFFLLLKKIWWVWVYFAVEKMFPVTGTYRKEGFKFFLLNPRKISEEILLSSSCELQCSDHSKETTMRRFSLWALYGGTSDRQDVMNTVWVGRICSLKNLTSFMYLMQKESWTATWKTWTQLVRQRFSNSFRWPFATRANNGYAT